MPGDTLLAQIVKRFVPSQWENVATESLAYLLRRPGVDVALSDLVRATGVSLPADLSWRTQAHAADDPGIPDLVGDDTARRHVLMVEVKFGAGLTPQQPQGYLRRQDDQFRAHVEAPRMMAFVVPDKRVEALAAEVAARISSVAQREGPAPTIAIAGRPRVVILSWRQVLLALEARLAEIGDDPGLAALEQLRGMCDRADREALLPLAPEDIGSDRGRILLGLVQMVDRAAGRIEAQGVATKSPDRKGYVSGWRLSLPDGRRVRLRVDLERWATVHPTPFWVRVYKPGAAFRQLLRQPEPGWELRHWHDEGDFVYVAVEAPVGVESDLIIEHLSDTVISVLRALGTSHAGGLEPDDPM